MSLQEIYYVAEIVVGLTVIISIVFVAIELKQHTYMLRRSMADQREERINWFLKQCVQTTISEPSDIKCNINGASCPLINDTEV